MLLATCFFRARWAQDCNKKTSRAFNFRVTGTHVALLDCSNLFSISFRGDDVQGFDTRWDEVSLLIHPVPSDDLLESLYEMCIRGSDQVNTVLDFYEQDVEQDNSQPGYLKLKTVVKRCLDQKI